MRLCPTCGLFFHDIEGYQVDNERTHRTLCVKGTGEVMQASSLGQAVDVMPEKFHAMEGNAGLTLMPYMAGAEHSIGLAVVDESLGDDHLISTSALLAGSG